MHFFYTFPPLFAVTMMEPSEARPVAGPSKPKVEIVKISKTITGAPMLITSLQFRFRKQRTNADGSKIYWVCTKGSCPARLTTDDNYNFMSSVNSHNHSETVQETDRKVVNAKMKDLAKSGKFLGQPMALIGEALKDLSEESQAALPKLDHLRRNIHNWQTERLLWPLEYKTYVVC